jgi:hypothetical protein
MSNRSQAQQIGRVAGFRLSRIDLAIILTCAALTWLLWDEEHWVLIIPFVFGHFFLFCNVFRVRSVFELTWAALLIVNFGFWVLSEKFSWLRLVLCQTPVTTALILLELRSKRYHGIGCRRINPEYVGLWENGELK